MAGASPSIKGLNSDWFTLQTYQMLTIIAIAEPQQIMQKRLVTKYTGGNFLFYFSCSLQMVVDGQALSHWSTTNAIGLMAWLKAIVPLGCTFQQIVEYYDA